MWDPDLHPFLMDHLRNYHEWDYESARNIGIAMRYKPLNMHIIQTLLNKAQRDKEQLGVFHHEYQQKWGKTARFNYFYLRNTIHL